MKIHDPGGRPGDLMTITASAELLGLTRQEASTLILSHGIPTTRGKVGLSRMLDRAAREELRRVSLPIVRARKAAPPLVTA